MRICESGSPLHPALPPPVVHSPPLLILKSPLPPIHPGPPFVASFLPPGPSLYLCTRPANQLEPAGPHPPPPHLAILISNGMGSALSGQGLCPIFSSVPVRALTRRGCPLLSDYKIPKSLDSAGAKAQLLARHCWPGLRRYHGPATRLDASLDESRRADHGA